MTDCERDNYKEQIALALQTLKMVQEYSPKMNLGFSRALALNLAVDRTIQMLEA